MHGPATGRYRYSDEDIARIATAAQAKDTAYCLFQNPKCTETRRLRAAVNG